MPYHRRKKIKLSLVLSFLLALTIPLALFTYGENNFDIRNYAVEQNSCEIVFPYVNPYTLQLGSTFTVNIEIRSTEPIETYSINVGGQTVEKNLTQIPSHPTALTDTVIYTAKEEGTHQVFGEAYTKTKRIPCKLSIDLSSSKSDNSLIRVIKRNSPPQFITQPYADKSATVAMFPGMEYNFVLKATDPDQDKIHYEFTFSPGDQWLHENVVKDGSGGDLEVQYTGSTVVPGSYLANVFIHDGYKSHLRSLSWVISVEPGGKSNTQQTPGKSDLPAGTGDEHTAPVIPQDVLTALSSVSGQELNENSTITLEWEVNDQTGVTGYRILVSPTPQEPMSWQIVQEELEPSQTSYALAFTQIPEDMVGKEVFVAVEAIPAGNEIGDRIIFGPIKVQPPATPEEQGSTGDTDDNPVLDIPQITDVAPHDGDILENPRPTIKATLLAGKQATIVGDSIVFTLDGVNLLTQSTTLNVDKTDVEKLLSYKPTYDLASGDHRVKVAFKDSQGREAEKEWVFTVEQGSGNVWTLFGWEIPAVYGKVILIAIGVLLLALLIPWILYLLWRNTSDYDEQDLAVRPTYTPPEPQKVHMAVDDHSHSTETGISTNGATVTVESDMSGEIPSVHTTTYDHTITPVVHVEKTEQSGENENQPPVVERLRATPDNTVVETEPVVAVQTGNEVVNTDENANPVDTATPVEETLPDDTLDLEEDDESSADDAVAMLEQLARAAQEEEQSTQADSGKFRFLEQIDNPQDAQSSDSQPKNTQSGDVAPPQA